MNSALPIPLLTAVLLVGVLLHGSTAHACSCVPPPPPAVAAANATAVFEGHVQKLSGGGDPTVPVRVELHVVRSFKGAGAERLELTTPASSASCGYGFEVGQSYLVYASAGPDGALRTNLCSRTRPMAQADEDLAALGMGATPVDPNGPGATPDAPEETEKPASGGCASCSVGGASATDAWPLVLALLCVARRRWV